MKEFKKVIIAIDAAKPGGEVVKCAAMVESLGRKYSCKIWTADRAAEDEPDFESTAPKTCMRMLCPTMSPREVWEAVDRTLKGKGWALASEMAM